MIFYWVWYIEFEDCVMERFWFILNYLSSGLGDKFLR